MPTGHYSPLIPGPLRGGGIQGCIVPGSGIKKGAWGTKKGGQGVKFIFDGRRYGKVLHPLIKFLSMVLSYPIWQCQFSV